ncbi:DUF4173 domain-containing protein [Phenylobacterium sp. VNQ135]|uniref:DUF4153 domain-containing protein n=1 Tax=Phenylobacterium sp. VNQ135 TaxID=3400922 RepID=UPI003C10DE62
MPLRVHSYWLKLGLGAALVGLAELLLFDVYPGLNLGVVGSSLLAAVGLTNRGVWRWRASVFAFVAALAFGLLQIERASLLGCILFALALGVCVLAPRAPAADDAGAWGLRLGLSAIKALLRPWQDLARLLKARERSRPMRLTAIALAAVAPVVGGAGFLWLFSAANPMIAQSIGRLRVPEPDVARIAFGLIVGFVVYTALRPRGPKPRLKGAGGPVVSLPTITTASVGVSLVVFNAIFALQNGLDIAFLWSGARLPQGVSLAEYAHRGAYPLIATALLAGLFVLIFLRPGTPTATSRPIRVLVAAWLAQNVFLVASTILRTLDYIEAYSLTRMRLAALIWMVLVAAGLILIGWRLMRGKSGSWLVNANAMAAGLALILCSVVDLGAVSAAWNVRHAREVGGEGVELDLCHLQSLNGAALVSLAQVEQRPLPAETLDRVRAKRAELRAALLRRQADWRSWRWRDARRLARNESLPGRPPAPAPYGRSCDGAPLTRLPKTGT